MKKGRRIRVTLILSILPVLILAEGDPWSTLRSMATYIVRNLL